MPWWAVMSLWCALVFGLGGFALAAAPVPKWLFYTCEAITIIAIVVWGAFLIGEYSAPLSASNPPDDAA